MRDEIFASRKSQVGDFVFDQEVVEVFPDMISRSVPGYSSILAVIGDLAARYAQPATRILDLGCSLGAATFQMQQRVPADCTILAVDNSNAMVARLHELLNQQGNVDRCKVEVQLADLRDFTSDNASFAVLNLVLQFIPRDERELLLQRVCESLNPGGALLLSEKIRFDDPAQQELIIDLHHEFKRANGYSDLEIAEKRTAIENLLIPESLATHTDRLQRVGFRLVVPFFQCFNFASLLAVKE